jgi:hypothetical protein
MNDRLRVIRDSFEVGGDVYVLRHGPRPRPARVRGVLRTHLRVEYQDRPGSAWHTVSVKDCVHNLPTDNPPPAVEMPRVIRRRTVAAASEPEAVAPPTEPPPPPAAPAKPDDVQAWLDMGTDIATKLEADIAALEGRSLELQSEIKTVSFAISEARARLRAVRSVITP